MTGSVRARPPGIGLAGDGEVSPGSVTSLATQPQSDAVRIAPELLIQQPQSRPQYWSVAPDLYSSWNPLEKWSAYKDLTMAGWSWSVPSAVPGTEELLHAEHLVSLLTGKPHYVPVLATHSHHEGVLGRVQGRAPNSYSNY